ncbi:MAG: c-type cytochrome [Bacteroidetes bacterium]|nr:c-type cytochrome [Bacteroidota bacterium]
MPLKEIFNRVPGRSTRVAFLIFVIATLNSLPVFAGGPPVPSALSNSLALTLVTLMIILLVIIAMLGKLLVEIAGIKLKTEMEEKTKNKPATTGVLLTVLLLLTTGVMAQDDTATAATVTSIGGLSPVAFYSMLTIIFIELLIILALIINIKFLLKKDVDKVYADTAVKKESSLNSWWAKFNKLKPIEQESSMELEHEYDGIRELDNRLPPWWLYGFYATIIFGVVYLWRYHVAYSAPLSKEELEISIKTADTQLKAYLAKKGESIDENTVVLLTDAADIAEGKKIFTTSCAACHKEDGGGLVGPNLTDDYWMHGGDVKSIFKTIRYGINAMPQWQSTYSNKQIAQVTSYIKSLHGTNPPDAKPPQGEIYKDDSAATPGNGATSDSTKQQ